VGAGPESLARRTSPVLCAPIAARGGPAAGRPGPRARPS
jgi:hypothetical protein